MWTLGCLLMAAGIAGAATAQQPKGRQHLVNPGDEWSHLAEQLRPGDEIILMPGVHRPAVLDELRGSPQRPIIIRSLNAEHAATINAAMAMPGAGQPAARHGILLRKIRHVVIQDLTITGASSHGIEASGFGQNDANGANTAPSLTLRNMTVQRIGPIGRRNGVLLSNLDRVDIEQCLFEGWGGSAIEIVACSDVTVQRCTFRGLEDYSQMNAVQIRAGSERVRISDCIMIDTGVTGIALGGHSDPQEFRNPPSQNPVHEAARVRVTGNLIRGGHSAVAFINCEQCSVRNNTIIRPERWVYLILDRTRPHLNPTARSAFAGNLIQWRHGDLQQFSHVNESAAASGLTLEQNLWWSPDLPERGAGLGEPAGSGQFPQVMDVDPRLDERYLPTEPRAMMFGRGTS